MNFRQKRVELKLSFVAVEQRQAAEILSELGFDSDLQEIIFEQNTIVFRHKPTT